MRLRAQPLGGAHALDKRVDGRERLGALVRLDAKADAGEKHCREPRLQRLYP